MPRLFSLAVFTLLFAILLQCSHGYDDNQQGIKIDDDGEKQAAAAASSSVIRLVQGHSSSSSPPKMNASMMLYFKVEDLRIGNKIPFFFLRSDTSPNFISREKADSIPLSLENFQDLLRFFSIPPGSVSADLIRDVLVRCNTPPGQAETSFCATSKESMFDFIRVAAFAEFGNNGSFKALWTTHLTTTTRSHGGGEVKNYKILSFKEYRAPRAVGCHSMPYPYAVYYCHYFDGGAKVAMTQLESEEDGERVEALVLCHMETSTFPPDHEAFLVLGTKPGTPLCHIFREYDLIFIPQL